MNSLPRLILILTAILACSSLVLAQRSEASNNRIAPELDPNSWKEFSSREGRFSARFPGVPTKTSFSVDTASGKLDTYSFVLLTSTEYRIAYTDFPVDLESQDEKLLLDGARDGGISEVKGKLLEEKDISLDGHAGRFFKAELPSGRVARVRVYLVGNRLYQLLTIAPENSSSPNDIRLNETNTAKFFDSFKLMKIVGIITYNFLL